MKFTISRNYFLKEMNNVQRAISSRTTIPILTGMKLSLSETGLTLTGSDADISIETFINFDEEDAKLNVENAGAIVLPARFFNEIVKKLPEDMMTLEVLDQFQTKITSGKSEFIINGLDANNYPNLPMIDSADKVMLDAAVFSQIVKQTVIAVATHENRPILTGLHIILGDNQLLTVATDSHRLSQRKIPLETSDKVYDIVIPGKSLIELTKMLDDMDQLEMRIAENQVLFILGDMSFYSRLLEGNYPDTSRLIPTTQQTEVEFNASTLLASVERASLLSSESRNNVVKLTINAKEQDVVIYGNSPDVGNVQEDVAFESLSGEDLEISFNPSYLKVALRTFGQTQIKMSFTSSLRPFILTPSEDTENFIQLITPVRTFS